MIRYTVTQTIQSRNIDGNQPVDVQWYRGTNAGQALAALVQAAAPKDEADFGDLPESMRYRVLSVHLDNEVLPDPDTLTYDVAFDDSRDYALSDCAWWDNQYQPWSRVDCSGRMALVTMQVNGRVQTAAMLCEGHVNAYPEGGL